MADRMLLMIMLDKLIKRYAYQNIYIQMS